MSAHRMIGPVLRWRTAAALVVLVTAAGLGACDSSVTPATSPSSAAASTAAAAGKESTAQICQEIAIEITTAATPLLSLLQSHPSGDQLQTDIAQVKATASGWAQSLRTQATKAQDPVFAGTLSNTANQMDARVADAFNSDLDAGALQTGILQMVTAASSLYADCPQLPKLVA